MAKKIAWKKLLDMFTDYPSISIREWMTRPFVNTAHDNEVWATDGRSVLMIRKGMCPDKKYDRLEKRLEWIPVQEAEPIATFTIQTLRDALAKCPQEEVMEVDQEEKRCPECGGSGKVLWSYTASYGDEHFYDAEFDCPVCGGDGILEEEHSHPTGEYQVTDYAAVRILDSTYRALLLERLVDAAEMIGTETVTVLHRRSTSAGINTDGIVFGLADGIRLLIMPFLAKDEDDIVNMEVGSVESA